ncbi:UNVERIFIED_CONTAM: hypothetical protein Cloal_2081 [Acetivibrio alkalicellulosi]
MDSRIFIYLFSAIAVLGVSFFLMIRSADKKLKELKPKAKKKR